MEQFPAKMVAELQKLAGRAPTDCGVVGIGQPTAIANDCALNAFRGRRSFFVRYIVQGIDTREVVGFAGDTRGNVYRVSYSSELFPQDHGANAGHSTPYEHVSVEKCSKPVNLRVANGGLLTCFLRDP